MGDNDNDEKAKQLDQKHSNDILNDLRTVVEGLKEKSIALSKEKIYLAFSEEAYENDEKRKEMFKKIGDLSHPNINVRLRSFQELRIFFEAIQKRLAYIKDKNKEIYERLSLSSTHKEVQDLLEIIKKTDLAFKQSNEKKFKKAPLKKVESQFSKNTKNTIETNAKKTNSTPSLDKKIDSTLTLSSVTQKLNDVSTATLQLRSTLSEDTNTNLNKSADTKLTLSSATPTITHDPLLFQGKQNSSSMDSLDPLKAKGRSGSDLESSKLSDTVWEFIHSGRIIKSLPPFLASEDSIEKLLMTQQGDKACTLEESRMAKVKFKRSDTGAIGFSAQTSASGGALEPIRLMIASAKATVEKELELLLFQKYGEELTGEALTKAKQEILEKNPTVLQFKISHCAEVKDVAIMLQEMQKGTPKLTAKLTPDIVTLVNNEMSKLSSEHQKIIKDQLIKQGDAKPEPSEEKSKQKQQEGSEKPKEHEKLDKPNTPDKPDKPDKPEKPKP